MSKKGTYTGPVTGHVYDLAAGERIDAVAEGIGCSGEKSSPTPLVNGRKTFQRIFIRLRTPLETLTCSPIKNSEDFARRVAIIEGWFHSVIRSGSFELTFEARQLTDEEADELEEGEADLKGGAQ